MIDLNIGAERWLSVLRRLLANVPLSVKFGAPIGVDAG